MFSGMTRRNGRSTGETGEATAFAVAFSLYARHGRHLYGESPEWGLASAYH
jgi:hypothetical protein